MPNKKILFFYPSFEKGGATNILIKVINFLLKNNINIALFSCNAKYGDFIKSNKLKIIGLKKKNKTRLFFNLFTSFYLIKYLISNKEKITIFSFQSHLPAIFLAKLFNKKIIIRNSEEIFGATKYADKKIYALITLLLKVIFYNFADIIVAISTKSKNSLKKIIINKSKVKLIYNPYLLNNKKFKIKKDNKKFFSILCTGRLTKQKNFSLIVKAINDLTPKYPQINLILIGSGALKKNLIKLANKNTKFLDWTHNIEKYFLKSNLFILPSFYEGLPNALIDATYYNVPCISTDCSGARDILSNNKGGYIIPVDDLKELKKKISLVINNYKMATKRAEYAKKNSSKFTISNCNNYHHLVLNV
jgi:GalNAc-alpha-(1->4)-GalNAc-alpha-(1->3)-diNAcBac-PP-undecaprenol alpha-1,4-N-acetyl-D-galactosaminyltransferase